MKLLKTAFGVPVLALLVVTALSGCERPPIETEQVGYRGTGMALIDNPRAEQPDLTYPEPQAPAAAAGPKAGAIYQNVQVLGDLSVGQFTRAMLAITQWVAPEEGCNYCHNPANLADDSMYTKVVSRRMFQMTRDINANYTSHVQNTGVTCYTCHRGKNVPAEIWFEDAPAKAQAYSGNRMGQNIAQVDVGLTSLPANPVSYFFGKKSENLAAIRVATEDWQPTKDDGTIQHTEMTYGLMFHMSESLGVNCNFCHNSRSFANWPESRPQRVTAFHGTRMVSSLNNEYLIPLGPVYPDNRLGPTKDAPKANCATCHQGVNKPLGGAQMAKDYPAALYEP
ncbi:MAG: photosynthetic reaction center cytochrome PufC [Gammaproteobacteria bacterium]